MSIKINFEIGHEASLIKPPHPNNFTHKWELFVRGVDGNDISPYVEKVVFTLHESFPKPKRVCKEPPYVVKEAGYAGFEMPVTIYFRGKSEDLKKLEFKYDLDLQPQKVQREEYIFQNTSEDFKRRLLKGGGVIISKDSLNVSSSSKLSSNLDMKKHKHKEEPKVAHQFQTLFGTPITKSSAKVSPDPKSQIHQNKISPNNVKSSKPEKPEKTSSSSSSSKDKEKSDKHKNKHHSPSRDRPSENKESRKEKDDSSRHDKKKDKSHSKEKSSSKSKSKDKVRSSSPKRQNSPIVESKLNEPPPPRIPTLNDKCGMSSSKKSSKKDKKSSERDKKETKNKEIDKKTDHNKHSKEKEKELGQITNSTKDVLKEKPKHENKIENSNPPTPVNVDKKAEKPDSERKHKHKKKEKSKDHSREKDLTKDKKSSSKSSGKVNKDEINHTEPPESPDKRQKHLESRKQHHNENTHVHTPTKTSSKAIVNHETSDSDEDSHAPSSKIDSDTSLHETPIKQEESSPSPQPPVLQPERQTKRDREKLVKEDKKRKRKSKNNSDHSRSPSPNMEPPQLKRHKEEIKNGETISFTNANLTPTNNYESTSSAFISPTNDGGSLANDYMSELKDLQHKIMTLQDNNDLQQVVEMIAATGQYEITSKTFDFDLCALEPGLIKRLQEFFAATSCS